MTLTTTEYKIEDEDGFWDSVDEALDVYLGNVHPSEWHHSPECRAYQNGKRVPEEDVNVALVNWLAQEENFETYICDEDSEEAWARLLLEEAED